MAEDKMAKGKNGRGKKWSMKEMTEGNNGRGKNN